MARAHGINGEEVHKQDNADRFASLVCETLESARNKGEFRKLYVVAAPAFLGMLRKHQSHSLKHLIAGEIDKNLTTQTPEAIRKSLPDFL
jgi:protein required for attachment to host cells